MSFLDSRYFAPFGCATPPLNGPMWKSVDFPRVRRIIRQTGVIK